MIIKGIDFGNCILSSGALNFFGDGYWYEKYLRDVVPGYAAAVDRASFVTKTSVLKYRAGNLPLDENLQPLELRPKCIKIYFFKGGGMILNDVSLSGPGLQALLERGDWQKIARPFFISIMAVGNTPEGRLYEIKAMIDLLLAYKNKFAAPVGLQINVSCPNTKHNP